MLIIANPVIVLVWTLLSLLIGWLGRRRKFRFAGHFLVSILLSPLVGLIALLATSPRPRERMKDETVKRR